MIGRSALAAALLLAAPLLSSCGRGEMQAAEKPGDAPILLYEGKGASPGDVVAMKQVLSEHGFAFATADARQLNAMSVADLASHQLLIVPGGNFVDMGNALTPAASANVKQAVKGGLNYLGVCAGAFISGASPYNGFNLTDGVQFHFYSAEEHGFRKAAVPISVAGVSAPAEHYWEDGPQLSGWGEVTAKYPDGTPAVVQGEIGKGWMVLTGVHPEAPESWRRGLSFATPASADQAYAAELIAAALKRERMAHY